MITAYTSAQAATESCYHGLLQYANGAGDAFFHILAFRKYWLNN
jgi:hypothetical protein